VAKSSAVSSNGGLHNGGKPSLPSLISFPMVLVVISCNATVQKASSALIYRPAYLPAFINKDEFDAVVWALGDLCNLCG
jgi:hypothetical protein